VLSSESPQSATKAKTALEDDEIDTLDTEGARPHPRGSGRLGGAIQAGHQGDPGNAAGDHRDADSRDESPHGGQGAHEREDNGGEGDDRVELEPALHTRQERRAGDGAETEAAEQKTVAQRAQAEVPARDDGE